MLTLSRAGLQRRDEASAGDLDHDVGRDQRAGQRRRAVEPGGDLGRVVHAGADQDAPPSSSGSERSVKRPPANSALTRSPDRRPGRARRARSRGLVALAARAPGSAAWRSASRAGLGVGHALEPGVVEGARALGGVGRRVDDPERRRGRVLGRVRACTGTARSPRTAATRPAPRALTHRCRPPARAARRRRRRSSAARARPRRSFSAASVVVVEPDPAAARVVLGDHRPPGRDRHLELRRAAPRHRHHLQLAARRAVEDGAVEVEAERHLAVARRRRSTWPPRPRGRRCRGPRSRTCVEPVNAGTAADTRAQASPGSTAPSSPAARTARPAARASRGRSRAWPGRSSPGTVSAIDWISWPLGSVAVAANSIVGVAANARWAALVIANSGSGASGAQALGLGRARSSAQPPRPAWPRARRAAKNSGTACSIAPPPEIPSQRDLISPTSA